jgi:hypothetical protein
MTKGSYSSRRPGGAKTSGLQIGTRPKLDSGRLWVCTAPNSGRRNIVRDALMTLVGRETNQELNAFEAEELRRDVGDNLSLRASSATAVAHHPLARRSFVQD